MNSKSNDAQQQPGAPGAGFLQRQKILKAIEDFAARNGVPEEKIPGFAGQLLAFFERLTPSPVTRREFIKLSAAGASALLLNTMLVQSSCDSGDLGGIVGCNPPKTPTIVPNTSILPPATDLFPVNPSFTASVLRKEDMLTLKFDFYNLSLQEGNLVRVSASRAVFIVVTLAHGNDHAPQNIGEEAYLETAAEIGSDTEDPKSSPVPSGGGETPEQPGMVGARFAGPSRLAFKIEYSSPIPFTMAELLAWQSMK